MDEKEIGITIRPAKEYATNAKRVEFFDGNGKSLGFSNIETGKVFKTPRGAIGFKFRP